MALDRNKPSDNMFSPVFHACRECACLEKQRKPGTNEFALFTGVPRTVLARFSGMHRGRQSPVARFSTNTLPRRALSV